MEDPKEKARALFLMQLTDITSTLLELNNKLALDFPIDEDLSLQEREDELNHIKAIRDKAIDDYKSKYGNDYKIISRDGADATMEAFKNAVKDLPSVKDIH